MTIEELYREIGGNYQSIRERLSTEERIDRFIRLFLKDNSYPAFVQAMEQGNKKEAFEAIHTLKGVCANLSLDALQQISSEITEYLRADNMNEAMAALPRLRDCYEKHIRSICTYAGI